MTKDQKISLTNLVANNSSVSMEVTTKEEVSANMFEEDEISTNHHINITAKINLTKASNSEIIKFCEKLKDIADSLFETQTKYNIKRTPSCPY